MRFQIVSIALNYCILLTFIIRARAARYEERGYGPCYAHHANSTYTLNDDAELSRSPTCAITATAKTPPEEDISFVDCRDACSHTSACAAYYHEGRTCMLSMHNATASVTCAVWECAPTTCYVRLKPAAANFDPETHRVYAGILQSPSYFHSRACYVKAN